MLCVGCGKMVGTGGVLINGSRYKYKVCSDCLQKVVPNVTPDRKFDSELMTKKYMTILRKKKFEEILDKRMIEVCKNCIEQEKKYDV